MSSCWEMVIITIIIFFFCRMILSKCINSSTRLCMGYGTQDTVKSTSLLLLKCFYYFLTKHIYFLKTLKITNDSINDIYICQIFALPIFSLGQNKNFLQKINMCNRYTELIETGITFLRLPLSYYMKITFMILI